MKHLTLSNHIFRGAFYSLTIILGLQVALIELDGGRFKNFLLFSTLLSLIFVAELLSGLLFRSSKIKGHIISEGTDLALKIEELVHHTLLPFGLFISSTGFIFFNRQAGPRYTYLFLLFVALTILFTNIRAYYEHRSKVEARTHYIYDAVKMALFFASVNVFFNYWGSAEQIVIPVFMTGFLAIGLLGLTSIRYKKFEAQLALIITAAGVILSILTLLIISFTSPNQLQVASFATLGYYLASASLHHLMHRTLNYRIAIEYISIVIIAVILLFGLSR